MGVIEYSCNVTKHRMLTPTVFELAFETEQPFHFEAGQFISVVIPGAGPKGRDLRRAYSIASSPEMKPVELCVKLVEEGPGTHYLYRLKPGDTFKGYAPYGDFVYKTPAGRKVVFVATGTGLAPFRAMVLSERFKATAPGPITALLGVRTEDELLYCDTFEKRDGIRWIPAVSRPKGDWKGFRGRVTDFLRSEGSGIDWAGSDFYLCGNGEMITEMKALLAEKGVAKASIHQEKYY
ncbi:MAG: FAD-binding oxidoreductase [Oligoflexia bacterium]|nr:FAD-binding oxidoreductase [Oligoflexia bacterium]